MRAQTICACGAGTGLGAANPKGGAGAAGNPKGAGAGAAGAGAAGAAAGVGAAAGAAGAGAAGAAGAGAFSACLGSATGAKACCLKQQEDFFRIKIQRSAWPSESAHNQEGNDGGLGLEGVLPNKKNQLIQQSHTWWCLLISPLIQSDPVGRFNSIEKL